MVNTDFDEHILTDSKLAIEKAVERHCLAYQLYDHYEIKISGGKDSTCLMETAVIAGKRMGFIPDVYFFDEEIILPETVDYLERLRLRNDINLHWMCVSVLENNSWSREHPYWYPWDKSKKDVWVRKMPDFAETKVDGYDPEKGHISLQYLTDYKARYMMPKSFANAIGRRSLESAGRRVIAAKFGWHQPPNLTGSIRNFQATISPIVDWSTSLVWRVIKEQCWDWNRIYLKFAQLGWPTSKSRVGPLFGEEPSIKSHLIPKMAPEMWNLAERRLPGVHNLARYARTAIMGRGVYLKDRKVTCSGMAKQVSQFPKLKRLATKGSMRAIIKLALNLKTKIPVKPITRIALMGDSKAGRKKVSATLDLKLSILKSKGGSLVSLTRDNKKSRRKQVEFEVDQAKRRRFARAEGIVNE